MRIAGIACLLLVACQTTQTSNPCGDVFNRNTTEERLIERFGRDRVRNATVQLGEGETSLGTIVDGNEVVWKDVASRRNPRFVRVRATDNGIRIGTDLKTLESMNGAPFTLAGFGWDYAGTVLSWGNGKLANAADCRVIVRLAPGDKTDTGRVSGDREFSSSSPDMQRINPRVYEILLSFE